MSITFTGLEYFSGSTSFSLTNNFSIIFSFRPSNLSSLHVIFSKHNSAADQSFWFGLYTSKILFQFGDGTAPWPSSGDLYSSTGLSTGTLYHAVITRAGTDVKFYLNGALDVTRVAGTANDIVNSANPITIALNIDGGGYEYYGDSFNLKMINRVLSPAEVKTVYENRGRDNISDSVYADWKMEGGGAVAATISDYSGNGWTLTKTGAPNYKAEAVRTA